MLGGVQITDHDIGELALFLGNQIVLVAKLAHDVRVVCQRGHQFPNAFLDSFGDDDFALASQQFNRAHLPHVHADGVSRAPGLLLYGSERSSGFGRRNLIS